MIIRGYVSITFIDFMFEVKNLTDLRHETDLKHETPSNNGKINLYPHLDNDIQYRPNEINRIKDSFIAEICKRETISKTLSKYFPAFHYSDKAVLVLSATISSVCVASFATVTGTPVRIKRASLI